MDNGPVHELKVPILTAAPVGMFASEPLSRKNNFDAIRLFAAFGVLVSHSFPLTYGSDILEPIYYLSDGQTTLGTMAVGVFFVISGFLITRSFRHAEAGWRGIYHFVVSRALRLCPGLFVVLVLLAFVVGPVLTPLSVPSYYASPSVFEFVAYNASLMTFRDGLPGVFATNPFAGSVNGSLWTLKHEVRCYVAVLALGAMQLLRGRWIVCIVILTLVLAFINGPKLTIFQLMSYFFIGAYFYLRRPTNSALMAWSSVVALAVSLRTGSYSVIGPTCGGYLTIWLSLSPAVRLPKVTRYGDLSYGVYLYSFPIQQVASAALGKGGTWYLNCLIALPLAVFSAYVSWRFVERPSLRLKKLSLMKRGVADTARGGCSVSSKQLGGKVSR